MDPVPKDEVRSDRFEVTDFMSRRAQMSLVVVSGGVESAHRNEKQTTRGGRLPNSAHFLHAYLKRGNWRAYVNTPSAWTVVNTTSIIAEAPHVTRHDQSRSGAELIAVTEK